MFKRVTIAEVAREAGVSPTTVSLVLNGRHRTVQISESTAKMVREVAERLGYTPNHAARSLRRRRTNTLSIFLLDLLNPFYTEIARAARQEANRHGYKLHIVETNSVEAEMEALRNLDEGDSDGVIIATTWHRDLPDATQSIRDVVRRGLSAVTLIDYGVFPGIPAIRTDDEQGGYIATSHLTGLGHQRIAYLNYATQQRLDSDQPPHTIDRYLGYRRALLDAGVEPNPAYVFAGTPNAVGGRAMVREMLAQTSPRPTAIFCFNDQIAIGALRALFEAGIKVPDEMAVVGFDGTEASAFTSPALTTVEHSRNELGRSAVKHLVALLEGRALENISEVMPGKLVIRESCGALPVSEQGKEVPPAAN